MGYIRNGIYYKDDVKEPIKVGSLYKHSEHEDQRLRHQKDLLQPYNGDKPNGDFIRAYPEQSKRYFTDEQIREYGNQ
jgi:hypothetical protein